MSCELVQFHDTASHTVHVKPCMAGKITNVKGRWQEYETILDFMLTEYSTLGREEVLFAQENGHVQVNGVTVGKEYRFKNKDQFSYRKIWKEQYIPATEIKLLHEDEHFVVVSKPSGVCVHESSSFRHMHVLNIVQWAQTGYLSIRTSTDGTRSVSFPAGEFTVPERPSGSQRACYRIDKNTSGVCVLAKSAMAASAFGDLLQTKSSGRGVHVTRDSEQVVGEIRKGYQAMVTGIFPTTSLRAGLFPCGHPSGRGVQCEDRFNSSPTIEDWILVETTMIQDNMTHICELPRPMELNQASPMECTLCNAPDATVARTLFRRLNVFNNEYSLVEAFPLTGRLHQIRSQQWWLGHPIVNDEQYGGQPMKSDLNDDAVTLRVRSEVWGLDVTGEYCGSRSSSIMLHASRIHICTELGDDCGSWKKKRRVHALSVPNPKYTYSGLWVDLPSWSDGSMQSRLQSTGPARDYPR